MNAENKNLFIALFATALLAVVVFLGLKLFGQKPNSPIQDSKNETVETQTWVRGLRAIIAVGVCAEPGYFSACYRFEDSSCADTLQRLAVQCYETKKNEMPTVLRLPRDGVFWGRQLSICAVRTAEAQLSKLKSSNPDCKDISRWTEKNPAPTITKARFMFSAEFEMADRFCEPKGPVRACFVMDDKACGELMQPLVSSCLESLDSEIPGDLKIPQDTLIWGTHIGKCVGDALETQHAEKKTGDCRFLKN